jgi:hypothetical protein
MTVPLTTTCAIPEGGSTGWAYVDRSMTVAVGVEVYESR